MKEHAANTATPTNEREIEGRKESFEREDKRKGGVLSFHVFFFSSLFFEKRSFFSLLSPRSRPKKRERKKKREKRGGEKKDSVCLSLCSSDLSFFASPCICGEGLPASPLVFGHPSCRGAEERDVGLHGNWRRLSHVRPVRRLARRVRGVGGREWREEGIRTGCHPPPARRRRRDDAEGRLDPVRHPARDN
jgi:hypothetical protein